MQAQRSRAPSIFGPSWTQGERFRESVRPGSSSSVSRGRVANALREESFGFGIVAYAAPTERLGSAFARLG